MGLPVEKFIAATNKNKAVPDYIVNGFYEPYETIQTISNAMDVGNLNNIKRIFDLYSGIDALKKDMLSWSFNDESTIKVIKDILNNHKYLLEPHDSSWFLGLQNFIRDKNNF